MNAVVETAPWAGAVEAWLEASSADEIEEDISAYVTAEVQRAVAAERERCAEVCLSLFDMREDERARMHAAKCADAIRRPNARPVAHTDDAR